jgi:maleylacetoacetate isomerase
MANVVLHSYWRSSSSYRVRIALALKKVAHETVPVNLLSREQKEQAYMDAKNPMGNVPCLTIDGEPFIESVAIIELLDELYPDPPLFPRDPRKKAHVRALVEIVNSGTQPFQNLSVLARLDSEDARKAWAQSFIARGLGAFEVLLARRNEPGPFCCGDTMGAADVFLVPQVMGAVRFGVDLEPMPLIRRAHEAAQAHPAVIAARPETQPDAPKS